MTPVGNSMRAALFGQVTLEGVPVRGLVDTGTSLSCLGYEVYLRHQETWGPLEPYHSCVSGADGEPLP